MRHPISSPETYPLRQPVLEQLTSLKGRWKLVEDGSALEVDLQAMNSHERALVEFVLNPLDMRTNLFAGLDRQLQRVLAKAVFGVFG